MVVDIISVESYYTKFAAVLPVNRICLLLLGDRPSPFVASRVLRLVQLGIHSSISFSRKFELISGWSVLKTVVPEAWDSDVNQVAFDVMRGPAGETVQCPQMVPVILSALQTGLNGVARDCGFDDEVLEQEGSPAGAALTTMESLVMDLINVHATNMGFRQVFKSQQTTRLFVEAYRSFTSKLMRAEFANRRTMGLLEKISHFGIALAVDDALAGAQKREVRRDKCAFWCVWLMQVLDPGHPPRRGSVVESECDGQSNQSGVVCGFEVCARPIRVGTVQHAG